MPRQNISLVIPAHNEERYIGPCLEHVIQNSGGVFLEIIVIDNASTDRTAEVAKTFPGVRVVREEQKGLTRARQRGYIEARGDILAYIDADTHMPRGWADAVRAEFEKNPRVVCVSGPYIYYDMTSAQQFIVRCYWNLLIMPFYWIVGYLVVGGNFAIRKKTLDSMGGFDTSIEFYGEDQDIARRAHEFGLIAFRPHIVMYTSARRLVGEGMVRTALKYLSNGLSQTIFHKPTTKKYKDIR